MPTLHEVQRQFSQSIFEHEDKQIQKLIRPGTLGADAGLGVYRNNVFTNLREALRTLFPVINNLVGGPFFNYVCEFFIRNYPSPAGDLNQYGRDFARFLAAFSPASELTYLPDVARLEWAVHQVYHAREVKPLDRQRLALIPPHNYGALQFILNPACMLLQSDYPIRAIWQVNQPDYPNDNCVDLGKGGVTLLVRRHDNNIVLDSLGQGEFAFLIALARQASFADACSQVLHVDQNFSLKHAMAKFVEQDVLVDFHIPENRNT